MSNWNSNIDSAGKREHQIPFPGAPERGLKPATTCAKPISGKHAQDIFLDFGKFALGALGFVDFFPELME